jgi:hypothetical protein
MAQGIAVMSADQILSHLAKVRKMGPDRWMACCPSHQDKSPSLSIRETSDGRVLLHCWTGCSANEILESVGLTFDALFPEKLTDHAPRERIPFSHREAMAALVPEMLMVALIGRQMTKGVANDYKTQQALITAVSRISAAHSYVEGL